MNAPARITSIRDTLILRRALQLDGVSDREIRWQLSSGSWTRVAQGIYAQTEQWNRWFPGERYLARVIAADLKALKRRPIFSHHSAAVIHGLANYGLGREPVHLFLPESVASKSSPAVVRHIGVVAADEIVEIGGLLCTSLERTLLDVALLSTPESGVVCLDSGVRSMYGRRAAEGQPEWRERQLAMLEQRANRRGVRSARRLILFTDGRAESSLESLSRLQLVRLGYAVDLQVEVAVGDRVDRADFEFVKLGIFGEVDGRVKYADERMRGDLSIEEVLMREKEREDLLRGASSKRFVRWGSRESTSALLLRERLRLLNVPPPVR